MSTYYVLFSAIIAKEFGPFQNYRIKKTKMLQNECFVHLFTNANLKNLESSLIGSLTPIKCFPSIGITKITTWHTYLWRNKHDDNSFVLSEESRGFHFKCDTLNDMMYLFNRNATQLLQIYTIKQKILPILGRNK